LTGTRKTGHSAKGLGLHRWNIMNEYRPDGWREWIWSEYKFDG